MSNANFFKTLTDDGWKEEKTEAGETPSVVYNSFKGLEVSAQRFRLPIYEYRDHILYLLEQNQVLIVQGQTGCGKSTQIAQYLSECNWNKGDDRMYLIGITQPRRVAAVNLATRVAAEMKCELGEQVGYTIRFEDCISRGKTLIKYMTEGILINEMMGDPLLENYSVVIVDEAHERTLNTDVVLGLLKKILKKRPELRVIVSSATIETNSMQQFFASVAKTAIIRVEGRVFPVDVFYLNEPAADYVKASINAVIKIHENESSGDVLVFLTGQEEVERVVDILFEYARSIKERKNLKKMYVLPMYASLPASEQLKVFESFPKSVRKVVVATNIAEASITIDGIVYVVDCGFVKLRFYNPKTCTDSLVVVPISKASADQRAGRAGRTRAGKVYRLYKEEHFEKLSLFTPPEIERSNLSLTIVQLKALGINNILKFEFPSPPPNQNIITALELLYALGAIDDSGSLTDPLGLQIAEFPLDPQYAKMLLSSASFGCSEEALTITAMLQVQSVFQQPSKGQRSIQARNAKHKFSVEEGDLLTNLNVYNAFIAAGKVRSWADKNYLNYKGMLRAVEVRQRLQSILNRFKVKLVSAKGDVDKVRKCIVSGFFANAAYLHHSGVYKTVRGGHELHIHPMSVLYTRPRPPPWVLFIDVLHTSQEFMRELTVIRSEWLYELAPHYYDYGTEREITERQLLTK
ncbi:ATP-dependent RNA helicase DHX35-like protein [Leptotrombidium deliense]|uniref:RNA helicase n=1 Tax=Leptotrombidium deliense TaxID=299467 RepID=A0A443SQX4_9ACAR|nr:ATP-dependent RNA helicase DHX35-like protein [Leptotrombidium deliense]